MFVVILFVSIAMIVIDRALYLRKSAFWKLIYQITTVILLHAWIFGFLPSLTKM